MLDKNTSYTSPANDSLYSHSYAFISTAIDKETKKKLKNSMQEIKNKLNDPEFFKEKIKNLLVARFAPLTTPVDLEKKIKETKFELATLSNMVKDRKMKLDAINDQLININKKLKIFTHLDKHSVASPVNTHPIELAQQENSIADIPQISPSSTEAERSSTLSAQSQIESKDQPKIRVHSKYNESQKKLLQTKNKLKNEKKSLEDQYTRFNYSLQILKENLVYFETRVKLETSGRFNGYLGQAVNTVVKTGPLAAVALTAANTAIQVKLAYDIPENSKLSAQEKKNARHNTMVTLACTAASVVFSLYIFPVVKEMAWYLWNYKPA